MEIESCRFCESPINKFMTYGKMPIANAFLTEEQYPQEYFFELAPSYCTKCSLFQLIDQPDPKLLFHEEYAFLAGTSAVMQEHFKSLANQVIDRFNLKPEELAVEIGNNDGGMVHYLNDLGYKHVGIDPSKNVSDIAISKGVTMINDFFGDEIASKVKKEFGEAKVFLAANTLAHIPDIKSVFSGVNNLLSKDGGVFITEDPYLVNVFEKTSYDQIYDEHVFIFSLSAMSKICEEFDLEVFDIEPLPTAGGSMRYFICRKGQQEITERKVKQTVLEDKLDLFNKAIYLEFKKNCERSKNDLFELLSDLKAKGNVIAGYGATSKSTTIFNYCGIDNNLIDYITDTTPTKINKMSPGKHIPIYDYNYFCENHPDYTYLLAWNHKNEIVKKESGKYKGRWITHTPKVRIHDTF